MVKRFTRAVVALAVISTVYWGYALAVVPVIEPPPKDSEIIFHPNSDSIAQSSIAQIDDLFPSDAWELNNPKVLQTEQTTILLKEYETLEDGRLRIKPLTAIY